MLIKEISPRSTLRGWLGLLGEVLITGGVLVVLLLVWLLWWTDRVGAGAAKDEVAQLQSAWAAGSAAGSGPAAGSSSSTGSDGSVRFVTPASPDVRAPVSGKAFAVLHIPRFGVHWQQPVVQGTAGEDLRKGVGHYRSSVMPGVAGNFAVAGHRTTWGHPFGAIDQLRNGDPIVVETAAGWFVYRVTGHEIVAPGDRSVLAAVPGQPGRAARTELLTLTTCHPKFSARQRWVVHAELETSRARSAGPPAGL